MGYIIKKYFLYIDLKFIYFFKKNDTILTHIKIVNIISLYNNFNGILKLF